MSDEPILMKAPGEEEVITPEAYRKAVGEREKYYARLSCGLVEVQPPPLSALVKMFRILGVEMSPGNLQDVRKTGSMAESLGVDMEVFAEHWEEVQELLGTAITVKPKIYPAPGEDEFRDEGKLYWDELLPEDQAALFQAASLLQEVVGRKFLPGEPGGLGAGGDSG